VVFIEHLALYLCGIYAFSSFKCTVFILYHLNDDETFFDNQILLRPGVVRSKCLLTDFKTYQILYAWSQSFLVPDA